MGQFHGRRTCPLQAKTITDARTNEGLKQGIVNSIVETDANQFLVATHGGGLVPFDGKIFGKAWTTPDLSLRQGEGAWVMSALKDFRATCGSLF